MQNERTDLYAPIHADAEVPADEDDVQGHIAPALAYWGGVATGVATEFIAEYIVRAYDAGEYGYFFRSMASAAGAAKKDLLGR